MRWFRKNKAINIKLVAIAKDEAAYLPEWIFHHLHFGFDAIDIYVNNTSDNTWNMAKHFDKLDSVNFINGDCFFFEGNTNPQLTTYRHAYKNLDKSKYSHLMFLDIDEFWYGKGQIPNVKSCLQQFDAPVALCLNWYNLYSEEAFSTVYLKQLEGVTAKWVKTIFSTSMNIKNVEIHNVNSYNGRYLLGDGSSWEFKKNGDPAAYCNGNYVSKSAKEIFILHRMYRSELEYVSMLSKGTADQNSKGLMTLRKNRHGYCIFTDLIEVLDYSENKCDELNKGLKQFIVEYQLEEPLKEARHFVEKRYHDTIRNIESSSFADINKINKITKNVTLDAVKKACATLKLSIMKDKKYEIADTIRTLAVSVEDLDVRVAEHLMSVAHIYKPGGPLIKQKLDYYRKQLSRIKE